MFNESSPLPLARGSASKGVGRRRDTFLPFPPPALPRGEAGTSSIGTITGEDCLPVRRSEEDAFRDGERDPGDARERSPGLTIVLTGLRDDRLGVAEA